MMYYVGMSLVIFGLAIIVKDVVKERVGEQVNRDLSMEDVVRKVVEVTGINEDNIVGKSRKKEFVEARQTAMFL